MVPEESFAVAVVGLIGLDIIVGGWADSRPGRRRSIAAVAHPWTTARRSLRAWAYRRHLRRTARRATRAGWYDGCTDRGSQIAVEEKSTSVDFEREQFNIYTSDLGQITVPRSGLYVINGGFDSGLTDHQRQLLHDIDHFRADFD